MFTISNSSDYGLIIISYLLKKEGLVPLNDLVKGTKLPLRFLARIASELAKHNILESKEGREGGYKVADKVKKITLYEYLKIFEDDVETCKCCKENYCCDFKDLCEHGGFLQNKLKKILVDNLKKIKLTDIFS